MKRTELERKKRDLKKREKKEKLLAEKIELRELVRGEVHSEDFFKEGGGGEKGGMRKGAGVYIKTLSGLFRYDEEEIYNLSDERILNVLIEIKEVVPRTKWDNVLRKAIRSTKVRKKENAFIELKSLLED